MSAECQHDQMSSTFERGVYCCKCNEPLVGFFWPFSRNTAAGALIYALRKAAAQPKEGTLGN